MAQGHRPRKRLAHKKPTLCSFLQRYKQWENSPWSPGMSITGRWDSPSLGHIFIAKDSEDRDMKSPLGQSYTAPAPLIHLGPILRPSYEHSFDLSE